MHLTFPTRTGQHKAKHYTRPTAPGGRVSTGCCRYHLLKKVLYVKPNKGREEESSYQLANQQHEATASMRSRKQGRYTGHLKTASGVPFLCTRFLVAERSWDPRLLSVPSSLPSSCASDNIACTRSRSSRIELEVHLLLSKCPPILALKINKCTNAWNDSLAVINNSKIMTTEILTKTTTQLIMAKLMEKLVFME